MDQLRIARAGRTTPLVLAIGAALLAGLVAAPWWAGRSELRTIGEIAYLIAIAQMWNLLAGFGGMISIGQHAFIGIGGYALLVLALELGVSPWLCIPLAGLIAALLALPIAALVFRLRGAYFAIGTWVVADVLRLAFDNVPAIGGGSGKSLTSVLIGIPAWQREATSYWLALALGVGLTLAVYLFLNTRHGLALTALRDSEPASESLGIPIRRLKLAVFVASAAGLGMAGALIYLFKLRISPDAAFSLDWTALMIFIVVIGGIGTLEGPIIGTALFLLLRSLLDGYGTWYLILLGVVAVVGMLKLRQGVWGWVAARYNLSLFPTRRLVVATPTRTRAAVAPVTTDVGA